MADTGVASWQLIALLQNEMWVMFLFPLLRACQKFVTAVPFIFAKRQYDNELQFATDQRLFILVLIESISQQTLIIRRW